MHEADGGRRSGCLVCGRDLQYHSEAIQTICRFCNKEYTTVTICPNGHYICDTCHSFSAQDLIREVCSATTLTDPVAIAVLLMQSHQVKTHGP